MKTIFIKFVNKVQNNLILDAKNIFSNILKRNISTALQTEM